MNASAIACTGKTGDFAIVAIGMYSGRLADAKQSVGRGFERIGGTSGASQLVRQI